MYPTVWKLFQCKAVKCQQLTKLCLDLLHNVENGLRSTNNGAELFIKFKRIQLTTQNRIKDQTYCDMMDKIRSLRKDEHLTPEFLEKLDELTMNDLKEDPEYLFAPHIVTSRYEREMFN